MNQEKYQKYKDKWPSAVTESVIEGGCHAYFGMYGVQRGDGVPSIDAVEQIEQTVKEIVAWIDASPKEGK